MSTSEDATEQKKSEDRPRSSRFRQTSAHIDHLSVGKYDKFRGTTSTISTFQQKIQKKTRQNQKRMHINIRCRVSGLHLYLYLSFVVAQTN